MICNSREVVLQDTVMTGDSSTGGCPNADYLDEGHPIEGRPIREHHTEGKPTSDDPARKLALEDIQVRLLSG